MHILITVLILLISNNCYAHQPVMDMAPRWEDGYGFQFRYENYGSNKLRKGSSATANPLGLNRFVEKTWFEGVYTFDRSKRITFKLPYVNQKRTTDILGTAIRQKESGLGDLIVGVPLKQYSNNKGFTSNFSFTPSLRIPTGSSTGDFPISDGSWDLGLSFSYSSEKPTFYQLYDLFYWINTDGTGGRNEGNQAGLDINWGIHPYHDKTNNSGMFLMLDVSARHNEKGDTLTTSASGGSRIHTGPVLVLYYDNIMFRTEYKLPVYEDVDGISLSRGQEFQVGIGMSF